MSLTPTRSYNNDDVVSAPAAPTKVARANMVTPPPTVASQEHGRAKASFLELEFLCQFLGISKESDMAAVDEFFM